jgi:Fe-S-cluster containining protein
MASAAEVEGLAAALGLSVAAFTAKHVEKSNGEWVTFKARQSEGGAEPCTLLGDDGRCTAYAARPLQCKTYPFWDVFMTSREAWEQEAVLADLTKLDAGRKGQRHWDPVEGGCEGLTAADAPRVDPAVAEAEAEKQRAWDQELEVSLKRKPLTGGASPPSFSDFFPGVKF